MPEHDEGRVASAPLERNAELGRLVAQTSLEALDSLLDHPLMDEFHLCLLLERKDLPGHWLERLAGEKGWVRSYRVRLRLARHPHTPRRIATHFVRELHLFDLLGVSLLPSAPPEIRRLAEELVLARLPQLPLGEKLTLARRSPSRVAAALLVEGHPQVMTLVLDNAMLGEGQVLKVLAREGLPERVVAAVARHPKWASRRTVRHVLVRHPLTPLAFVLRFLAEMAPVELRELEKATTLPANLRGYVRHELDRRGGRRGAPAHPSTRR